MSGTTGHRVGITGHQTLSSETRKLIFEAAKKELAGVHDLITITSLAAGADQICAEAALEIGGRFLVVLPAENYAKSFDTAADLENFHRLLARADEVVRMPFGEPSEQAYWAAGCEIVDRANWLLAIWDGKPAGGLGGTADVVHYAHSKGKEVRVIWPKGARRA